jgi:hypothetical protein
VTREEWLTWVDTLCWIGESSFSLTPEDWEFLDFACEWRRELLEQRDGF